MSDVRVATPVPWLLFARNNFSRPFTFNLYISLGLKWASQREYIVGSCFQIHSFNPCPSIEECYSFTFKVIPDRKGLLIAICLYVREMFFVPHFLPYCFPFCLICFFSDIFWFPFRFFVCVFSLYFPCGYHGGHTEHSKVVTGHLNW